VNGDVVIAGGDVEIGPGALIRGDLILTGGMVTNNGIIQGRTRLYGGELHLNGQAQNGLEAKGGKLFINGMVVGPAQLAATDIVLLPRARFRGPVHYWQEGGPLAFGRAMVTGRATYRPDLAPDGGQSRWYYLGSDSPVFMVIFLSSALLLLFLFQFLLPGAFAKAGSSLSQGMPREMFYGTIYLMGLPLLSVILVVTVIGIPVGIFALFFYLFTLVMAHIITSLVIANWYNTHYHRHWTGTRQVFVALAVFITLKLVLQIPLAGWLLSLALIIWAFGAVIASLRGRLFPRLTPPA
jgi:cytoskeletal protein CcmA (bactofilin family)